MIIDRNGLATRAAILKFVYTYMRNSGGRAPTVRDICRGTGIASTNTVSVHLRELADGGDLVLGSFKEPRGITIPGSEFIVPDLPEWVSEALDRA